MAKTFKGDDIDKEVAIAILKYVERCSRGSRPPTANEITSHLNDSAKLVEKHGGQFSSPKSDGATIRGYLGKIITRLLFQNYLFEELSEKKKVGRLPVPNIFEATTRVDNVLKNPAELDFSLFTSTGRGHVR